MNTINPNMVPANGYEFQNQDGVKLTGNSWGGLARQVREYRQRIGQPVGDPRSEILAQACERNPALCVFSSERPIQVDDATKLKVRRLQWLTVFRKRREDGEDIPMVKPEEAAARVEVCVKCHSNKQVSTGCSACASALNALRRIVIGDRQRHERVNACVILGSDLVTAVHLDELRVNNEALPPTCWRKTTL